jgi:hypothetical protein
VLKPRDLKLLTQEYGVETPIKVIGNYISAKVCMPHNCGDENAACAINMQTDEAYVLMHDSNKDRWYPANKRSQLPQAVQNYMSDFAAQ